MFRFITPQSPSFVWTEDYQVDYLMEHFKAFDDLRANVNYFIGEMIWNFADFATPQGKHRNINMRQTFAFTEKICCKPLVSSISETFRPWGCMKGIFTRERQPKGAAYLVRWRYWQLANQTGVSIKLPRDLVLYRFQQL